MLVEDSAGLVRGQLRFVPEYYWGYLYCWLRHWDSAGGSDAQLPLSRFESLTGFREVSGWTESQYDVFLSWAADHQALKIDRQTGEALLLRTMTSAEVAAKIFTELL
jgi:hypothetical protein